MLILQHFEFKKRVCPQLAGTRQESPFAKREHYRLRGESALELCDIEVFEVSRV